MLSSRAAVKTMPGPKPQLVALLLCNEAFQQAGTGKWCIIGVFDTLNAPQLPFTLPEFSVYVALSDFAGDQMVELQIRDEGGTFVKAVRGKIPRIPLGLFQYVFPFPEVEFKEAGVHTLELLAGGEIIALRSFRVQSIAVDPEQEDAEANALDAEHRERIVKDALEVWEEHPEACPVGLIASPGASQAPWFRQQYSQVFGGTPPQASFVGIMDPDTLIRLLGDEGGKVTAALEPARENVGRMIAIALVTRSGYKFVYHGVERDWGA